MITLNNLTNCLVQTIVVYNKFNIDNQPLNSEFFDSIRYSKLQQLLNLCPKKTIRHDLFHYFLHLVQTLRQFSKPTKPLTHDEEHQLEVILVEFYTNILLLLKAYQSQKIQISFNNQTILVPGLQRGITSGYRLCKLGELIQQLFIKPQSLDFTLPIEENILPIKQFVYNILKVSQEPLLIADLSTVNRQLTQHVEADNTTIKLLENNFQEVQQQLKRSKAQNEMLEAELQSRNATIQSQAKAILALEIQQSDLREKNQELQNQLTSLKKELPIHTNTIVQLKVQLKQSKLAYEQLETVVAAKQSIIDEQTKQTQSPQWTNYGARFPFALCFFNQQRWIKPTPNPDVKVSSSAPGCSPRDD